MNEITLKKYHGLGNDYLVLDPNRNTFPLQSRNIEMLCRRNFGVGADGSEAEQSGNGVRIFAKYLLDAGYIKGKELTLDLLAGEVKVEFLDENGSSMRVNMGKPVYAGPGMQLNGLEGEVVNAHLRFWDNDYNTTCLSVGNPNCVIMMEEVTPQKAKMLGPFVEQSPYFPNRTNMQLCKVIDRKNIAIEIYERGAGYTLASGTGACAAVAAAKRMGLVDNVVTVHMQGGDLTIEIDASDTIYMAGSVEQVGTFTLAEHFLA